MAMTMPTPPDSPTRPAPPAKAPAKRPSKQRYEPPANAPARAVMSMECKQTFLLSARVVDGIRKVARSHRVPEGEHDDIVQETRARALKADVPENEDEAHSYVYAIAKYVCLDYWKDAADRPEEEPYIENPSEADGEVATRAAAAPPDFEARDALNHLVDRAAKRFPAAMPAFLQATTLDQTAEQVAQRTGQSPGHIRKDWSRIRRFLREHGRTMGLLATLAIVVLVWGSMKNWTLDPHAHDVATPRPPELDPPPGALSRAVELRQRAEKECSAGDWGVCLRDLDEANRLDPVGETPALRELRDQAERHAR
jgi:RNA polymerase sigma factor (sigma-70 family)